EDGAVRADELDRGALLEAPFAADDSHPQQARPFLDERPPRALVDEEPPGDGLTEAKPELEGRLGTLARREARAPILAGHDRAEDRLALPAGDHRRDARGRRHLGRDHLAPHAAAAEVGAGSDLRLPRELSLEQELRARGARRGAPARGRARGAG